MQATIERLKREDVQVEIPDVCPKCGANFKDEEENNLKEDQWIGNEQRGFIGSDGIQCNGSCDPIYEYIIITGYRCGACDESIVSTEEEPPIAVPAPEEKT